MDLDHYELVSFSKPVVACVDKRHECPIRPRSGSDVLHPASRLAPSMHTFKDNITLVKNYRFKRTPEGSHGKIVSLHTRRLGYTFPVEGKVSWLEGCVPTAFFRLQFQSRNPVQEPRFLDDA